jgi:hypothetical protein
VTFIDNNGAVTGKDPTHGRIDADIQCHVEMMQRLDRKRYTVGTRVALENTLQNMRDKGQTLALEELRDL